MLAQLTMDNRPRGRSRSQSWTRSVNNRRHHAVDYLENLLDYLENYPPRPTYLKKLPDPSLLLNSIDLTFES
jgi:hypothetical protein